MTVCIVCNKVNLLAEGGDGYDDAINELTQTAKRQDKQAAKLTRVKRNQLILEQRAAKRTIRSLKKAQQKLIDRLRYDLQNSSPEMLRSLATNRDLMTDYLLKNGFGDATADWIQSQQEMLSGVFEGVQSIDPLFNTNQIDPRSFQTLQLENTQAVFDDLILADTTKALRTALTTIDVVDDTTSVLSALANTMQKSTGRQLTEVKTKISEFGRASNAIAAKEAGLDQYLYTGPLDGLTRGFCFHLVNKVVNSSQMRKLNNNQIGNPLISGGGYNCRHSWSPVSKGYVEAADLELATDQDIRDANRAAKGG